MNSTCRILGPLAVTALSLLCGGCGSDTESNAAPQLPQREWLTPVRTTAGLTGRSVLSCQAGRCVIFHFPPTYETRSDVNRFLKSEAVSQDLAAELLTEPDERWTVPGAAPMCTFNCCTYAVGDVAGLSVTDWLPSEASGNTLHAVPMQIILDSYFERIRVYRQPIDDWSALENDPSLQVGDVFCLVNTGRGTTPAYIHAGKICKKDGRNWVASKLGPGPIVRSTIKAIVVEYSRSLEEIWIYRQHKKQSKKQSV